MPLTPTIPETITVHLGPPDSDAPNVTVSFPDYIKNVASSEIYPTWPESAIRANIYAEISFALNRIYTEYYRNQGYDFQITNSIANDQSFFYGRDIFDNISQIVDEIFNSYIRREGSVEPLFAAYCDGIEVTCNGLSQWGSVDLAEQGLTPLEILRRYYGNDIELVTDVPITGDTSTAPKVPLRQGSAGPNVQLLQRRLNRISTSYPAIPKIYPTDGVFGPETERAVKAFQEVFGLTPDGIVGNATWYRVQYIYNGVKKLSELTSEGLTYSDISTQYPSQLQSGDQGEYILVLQYFLKYIRESVPGIPALTVDGSFGPNTANAVKAFQRIYGLPETGVVDEATWDRIYNVYTGLYNAVPQSYREGETVPFPGQVLRAGSEGDDVRLLQSYLDYISQAYPEIPGVPATGYFGTLTTESVTAFQNYFDLPGARGTVNSITWDAITSVYRDLYQSNLAAAGQYPGYDIS